MPLFYCACENLFAFVFERISDVFFRFFEKTANHKAKAGMAWPTDTNFNLPLFRYLFVLNSYQHADQLLLLNETFSTLSNHNTNVNLINT